MLVHWIFNLNEKQFVNRNNIKNSSPLQKKKKKSAWYTGDNYFREEEGSSKKDFLVFCPESPVFLCFSFAQRTM